MLHYYMKKKTMLIGISNNKCECLLSSDTVCLARSVIYECFITMKTKIVLKQLYPVIINIQLGL